jgi:hypothetical protein
LTQINDFLILLQERDNVQLNRALGPLPENAFVAAARDTIPGASVGVTTASARGNLRGRGRGRGATTREKTRGRAPTQEQRNSRGRGKGRKRAAASASAEAADATHTEEAEAADSARASKRGFNTGPGSIYYMLFGDEQRTSEIPDLNVEVFPGLNVQEFPISQNAPSADDT